MMFKTLLELQNIMIVAEILEEQFESPEAAIAKYGYNPLRVCESDGHQYELRIRQFARQSCVYYMRSPKILGCHLPDFERIEEPFDFYYKYLISTP